MAEAEAVMANQPLSPGQVRKPRAAAYAGLVGAWLGIAFEIRQSRDPDRLIVPPADFFEFVFQPWPVQWGYVMLAGLVWLQCWRAFESRRRADSWLPLVWLAGSCSLASERSTQLSHEVLKHFVSCVAGFYSSFA